MAASKSGFMKDALILFAITLISGVCLGFVYDITKAPIERATIEANNRTYKEVLSTAAEFSEVEGSAEKIAALTESGELEGLGYGSVAIESVLEGKDESGAVTGHVINSLSNNSYGGAVKISVGFDADGAITGVGIREINDTTLPPCLFWTTRACSWVSVTKTGASADNEIDAISGATVTSNAVTNAVNAALFYLHNCMNQEVGIHE